MSYILGWRFHALTLKKAWPKAILTDFARTGLAFSYNIWWNKPSQLSGLLHWYLSGN